MTPNNEYTSIDTPIQRINEDRLSGILGDLIAEAAAPVFDEVFKAKEEKTIVMVADLIAERLKVVSSAVLLADLIAERLKRHGTE